MKEINLQRFNEARRSWIEAGKFRLLIQRPTVLDIIKAGHGDAGGEAKLTIEFAARFVIGWENVTELDLMPGGDAEPVVFDHALFTEWVADRPDLWGVIARGISEAYRAHEERTEQRGNV